MIAYVDASTLVKIVRREEFSLDACEFLRGCDAVSSEVVAAEVLRSVSRQYAGTAHVMGDAIEAAMSVMADVVLIMMQTATIVRAGVIEGMSLRTLDAIHIATAVGLGDVDVFVTYDERQAEAARLAGLRTVSPGI